MKSGKVWGSTEVLLCNQFCEAHRFQARAGARCSMHKHAHKTNVFHVISGELRVVVEKTDYDLVDETILQPGETMEVKPGEYHRFEAVTDVDGIEIYYPEGISGDIIRRDHGEG